MRPILPTPDFSRALPDRAISVRPPQTVGPMSSIGMFVLLFGLIAGTIWWLGPDLARDWRIDGEVVKAEGARIEASRCRSRLVLVTLCDVTFQYGSVDDTERRTLWYFFIDRLDPEPIALVRPKADATLSADRITTNLGLDKLYHRLLALVLVLALLGACIVLSAQVQWQGIAARRALARLSGQRLVPVIVGIESSSHIGYKRRRWTYLYNAGGEQERAFIELPKGSEPLFVTRDGKQALALAARDGGVPLLLDAKLAALDLTAAEKETFFAVCHAAVGGERVA
jgi:hypothetical protein